MNLSDLKELTTLQRDEAREKAIKRVQRKIGERPNRKDFTVDLGRLWTELDVIALVVFVPALLISSIHIITHIGALSAAAYDQLEQATAGTVINKDLFVAAHQWLSIPLAEGSMILFMVMFGITRDGWRRLVYFALAAISTVFLVSANQASGIGALESILAPIFTIGIGLKLEHLIVQHLKRRHQVDEKYTAALAVWEAATQDATQHQMYGAYLANELWSMIIAKKTNQWAVEAPPGFKLAAVQRELAKDEWHSAAPELVTEFQPEEVRPATPVIPFGSTALTPDEIESTPLMLSANGHGITAKTN